MSIAARCTCDKYLTFCDGNCKSPEVTPDMLDRLKSVIGEQPMKEESQEDLWLEALDLIEVFADGISRIDRCAVKAMINHGYTLTKK